MSEPESTDPKPPATDGIEELASFVALLIVWVRKARIQITAHRLIINKHLNITDEEWKEAFAQAESSLPVDLKDPHDLDAIRTFLEHF